MLIFLMVYFFGNCVAQNIDTNEIIKIEKTRHLNNCIECDDNPDEYLTTVSYFIIHFFYFVNVLIFLA